MSAAPVLEGGGYVIIPDEVYSASASAFKVYAVIRRHDWGDIGYGSIPSLRRIAEVARLSIRTVVRCLDELESLGVLERHRRFSNEAKTRRTSNLYTFPDIEARKQAKLESSQVRGTEKLAHEVHTSSTPSSSVVESSVIVTPAPPETRPKYRHLQAVGKDTEPTDWTHCQGVGLLYAWRACIAVGEVPDAVPVVDVEQIRREVEEYKQKRYGSSF